MIENFGIKRFVAALTVLVALAACASPKYVTSDVTRFNTLSGSVSGQTFAIMSVSPQQGESIAFRQFGDQINARLTSLGMRQYSGTDPASADYVVTLQYEVYGPTQSVEVDPMPFPRSHFGFGFGRYGRHFGYGFAYDPFFDDYPMIRTRDVFTRRVEMDMYRGSSYNTDHRQRVFEGRAISAGRNGQIEAVMPYMLDAVIKDFPGQSGRTNTVTVQVPETVESGAAAPHPSAVSSY